MKQFFIILTFIFTSSMTYGQYFYCPPPFSLEQAQWEIQQFTQQSLQQAQQLQQQYMQQQQQLQQQFQNQFQFSFPALPPANFASPAPSSSNSYNSSGSSANRKSSSSRRSCRLCHGQGKCNTCWGSRRFLSSYGTGYVTCPNCTDGLCSRCHGSKVE